MTDPKNPETLADEDLDATGGLNSFGNDASTLIDNRNNAKRLMSFGNDGSTLLSFGNDASTLIAFGDDATTLKD